MVYPRTISIDNIQYYNANELKKLEPSYFDKCLQSIRSIIKLKNIDANDYAYGNYSKKIGWRLSANQINPPNKSKLLFKEEWVLKNIKITIENKNNDVNEIKNINVVDNNANPSDIPKAPDLLFLNDNEKFKDNNGNIIKVETRGKKTVNDICFLASDIAKAFEFDNLVNTMINKTSNYLEGEHYKIYLCDTTNTFGKLTINEIFITYEGTKEQKINLAAGLFGVPIDMIKQFLSTCASKIPCIYEIVLGICKDVRVSMNIPIDIPDDYIIVKYGFTDDLERRMYEHYKDFSKIKGVKLELVNYSYVDPKYLSQAEVDIKNFFADIEIKIMYENYNEFVAIKPSHVKQITNQYEYISLKYSGNVSNTINELEDVKKYLDSEKLKTDHIKDKMIHIENIHKLELEMKDEQYKNALKDEQYKLKDEQYKNALALKNEQYKNALLVKEIEIMKMNYDIEKLKAHNNENKLKN